jgi:anti-sigma factor (TIGR02949 family)
MKKLNCQEVIRQLYAYLDGELEPQSESEVDEHIHSCRECMSRAEFERLLRKRLIESTDKRAPEQLRRKLLSIIDDDD